MEPYYTVIIHSVPARFATVWHPVKRLGSFSELSRGAFETEEKAIMWAQEHLRGTPYTVRQIVQ